MRDLVVSIRDLIKAAMGTDANVTSAPFPTPLDLMIGCLFTFTYQQLAQFTRSHTGSINVTPWRLVHLDLRNIGAVCVGVMTILVDWADDGFSANAEVDSGTVEAVTVEASRLR